MSIKVPPNQMPGPIRAPEWEEDTSHDETWGVDEAQYWAEIGAKEKAAKKAKHTEGCQQLPFHQLPHITVEFTPCNVEDVDILGDIEKRQFQPRPITVTAKNPRNEKNVDKKRRMFANLHRQLRDELEKALTLGIYEMIDVQVKNKATLSVKKPSHEWDDMEMESTELEIRDIVRQLIANRQEFERCAEEAQYVEDEQYFEDGQYAGHDQSDEDEHCTKNEPLATLPELTSVSPRAAGQYLSFADESLEQAAKLSFETSGALVTEVSQGAALLPLHSLTDSCRSKWCIEDECTEDECTEDECTEDESDEQHTYDDSCELYAEDVIEELNLDDNEQLEFGEESYESYADDETKDLHLVDEIEKMYLSNKSQE